MTTRITALVELAVAAAGLAVYLAVLGGLQLWVKLEAAGLPSDVALSGYDPKALTASGIRALTVLPVAFCLLLVLVRVLEEDRPRSERNMLAKALSWLEPVFIQIVVGLSGLWFGLSALTVIASLAPTDAITISGVLKVAGLIAFSFVGLSLVPALLMAAPWAWRQAKSRWVRKRISSATELVPVRRPPAPRTPEPPAFAWARRLTSVLGKRRLPAWLIATGGFVVYLLLSAWSLLYTSAHGGDRGGEVLLVVTIALICLPYVFLGLRCAAGLWRTASSIEQSGIIDDTTATIGIVIVAAYALPLWMGAFVVTTFLLVFLAGQPPLAPRVREEAAHWLPSSLAGRALIMAIVIAACAVVFQTHQPQRFPLAIFPVKDQPVKGPVVLTANAALLGRADGQLLLGVCNRLRNGTSSGVQLIRVPADHVPAYRVVDGGYMFYRDREPTLLSGLVRWLGLPAWRPPSINTFMQAATANVCGPTIQTQGWVFDQLRRYKPPKAD